ncbi:Alpha/Beta hydrolase protein [Flagelloscypha sp. PMI_526]|nr:Alpha/Beta hydrolase protein [Flagelloscypha sp. PMI_526]
MFGLGIIHTLTSFWSFRWTQRRKICPLPPHITRFFIPTPEGDLELLYAAPADPSSKKSPILFQHGGFGFAGVWISWMTLMSQKYNYPVYALSLRGHGASWCPGYFHFTAAIREIHIRQNTRPEDLILVSHSAGGGLVQYAVKAIALVCAIPNFGAKSIFLDNWWRLDRWISTGLFHLNHSRSPLSSTRLVRNAFFTRAKPDNEVKDFEQYLSECESMWWPIAYMNRYTKVENILSRIAGWGSLVRGNVSQRILVVAGTEDKLMGVTLMEQMVSEYREGVRIAQNHTTESTGVVESTS